jgi:hypothetical protein
MVKLGISHSESPSTEACNTIAWGTSLRFNTLSPLDAHPFWGLDPRLTTSRVRNKSSDRWGKNDALDKLDDDCQLPSQTWGITSSTPSLVSKHRSPDLWIQLLSSISQVKPRPLRTRQPQLESQIDPWFLLHSPSKKHAFYLRCRHFSLLFCSKTNADISDCKHQEITHLLPQNSNSIGIRRLRRNLSSPTPLAIVRSPT